MFRAASNRISRGNASGIFRALLKVSPNSEKQLVEIRIAHVAIPFSTISSSNCNIITNNWTKTLKEKQAVRCCAFSTDNPGSDSHSNTFEPGLEDKIKNDQETPEGLNLESSVDGERQLEEDNSESNGVQRNGDDNSDASKKEGDRSNSTTSTWVEDDGIVIYTDKQFLTKRHQKNIERAGQRQVEEEEDDDPATESNPDQFNLRSLLQNIQRQRDEQVKKEQRPSRTSVMSVEELVDFLKENSAMDICVIAVPPEMDYVEYFVVCTGTGSRHIGRMADHLEEELRLVKLGPRGRRIRVEGRKSHEWMAVDVGTMVVHFMTESRRQEMELEKLWTLGKKYDDQSRALAKNYDQVMEMENK